jgi:hypothetical protein
MRHSLHGLLATLAIVLSAFTGLRTVIERPYDEQSDQCSIAALNDHSSPSVNDTLPELPCIADSFRSVAHPAGPKVVATAIIGDQIAQQAPSMLLGSARGARAP